MELQRKVGSVTITIVPEDASVLFEHDDGRKATATYTASPGVTTEDVLYSYDEEDALRIINDDNDRDIEAYQDASINEAKEKGLLP